MTVFIILAVAFALVGVWLIIYTKKRKRMVTEFAHKRGLSHRDKDDGTMEEALDRAFGLKTPYVRAFSMVRDIVSDGEVSIFRVSELIDLVPYAKAQNTNFGRIAAYFDIPDGPEVLVEAYTDSGYRTLHPPEYNFESDARFPAVKVVIGKSPQKHTLSVTFRNGKAIMYLQPLIVGGEKPEDIEYLYELAKKMKVAINAG